MISHIDIKNYRCLRDVSVPLKPLTVLVGPNDSGKSTFLDAVRSLCSQANLGIEDYWKRDQGCPASIRADSDFGEMRLALSNFGWSRPDDSIRHRLGLIPKFHLPSTGVSMTCTGWSENEGVPDIQWNGSNVAALVDYFLRADRKIFSNIESVLRSLIPGFNRLAIGTPSPSDRRLDLVIEGDFLLNGERASAGLRLLLFFVALAFHPRPPRVICIEEPESGVHPKRLADVIRLLREMTRGEHAANSTQVILTTHSPYLLDLIDPRTDQVLVFRRESDGSRSATAVDGDGLVEFLDEFKLGEVWYNEGEDRLIGKPSA